MLRGVGLATAAAGLSSLALPGCGPEGSEPTGPPETVPNAGVDQSEAAARVIETVRRRFSDSALLASEATAFRNDGSALVPELPEQTTRRVAHRAHARVGLRADSPFRIEQRESGMSLEVTLAGASDAEAKVANGYVVYPGALAGVLGSGGDVILRPLADGIEDWLSVEAEPRTKEVTYRVALRNVAGLRLVESVLEVLDASGSPRLRMAPPYLVDAAGKRHAASVHVDGCAYDTSPQGPWNRPVTAPGQPECTVRVSWAGAPVTYPILIDPAWTTTGSLATGRKNHTATLTSVNGVPRVLVVGGTNFDETVYYATAELFNPSDGTWSPTGSLPSSGTRARHTASRISTGVFVVGGYYSSTQVRSSTALYSNSGVWSAKADIGVLGARARHAAIAFNNDVVLVVGGHNGTAGLNTAGMYVATSNTWTTLAGMNQVRVDPAVAMYNSVSKVALVVGGSTSPGGAGTTSAQLFELTAPTSGPSGRWNDVAPAPFAVAGRNAGPEVAAANTSSVYVLRASSIAQWSRFSGWQSGEPGTWSAAASLPVSLGFGANSPGLINLSSAARVLAVPGVASGNYAFVASSRNWYTTSLLGVHTAGALAALSDGRALVVGGGSNEGSLKTVSVFEALANGGNCDNPGGSVKSFPGDCATLKCIDGVCCNNDCADGCQACSAALKSSGADGTCGPKKAGESSEGKCADAGGCGLNGLCDGSGGCQFYPPTKPCGTTSCAAGIQTGQVCEGTQNACVVRQVSCEPYACGPTACRTSCSTDSDCYQGYSCAESVCLKKKDSGQLCREPKECISGFCVDGVCCAEPCTSGCNACAALLKESGTDDGQCGPAKYGLQHKNCLKTAPETCGHDGACDGTGGCRYHASGTACGDAVCEGFYAKGQLCNGSSNCEPSGDQGVDCRPYLCRPGSGCASACQIDDDCVGDYWCDAGVCVPEGDLGDPCTDRRMCKPGRWCVDGVCCDTECTGQCEACDVAGKVGSCSPVAAGDAPHGGRLKCDSIDPACSGSCNGAVGSKCAFPGPETRCGGTQCQGNVLTPFQCNGEGTCKQGTVQDCGAYACDVEKADCKASCLTKTDCAVGAECNAELGQCGIVGATCKDAFTVIDPSGLETTCAPYTCKAGICLNTCDTDNDCRSGYACTGRKCVEIPSGSGGGNGEAPAGAEEDGGCGCRTSRGQEKPDSSVLLGLLGVAVLRRRRCADAGVKGAVQS
jgi:MYXO-CTERM domain-containing protein